MINYRRIVHYLIYNSGNEKMALENRAVCNGKFIAELRDPIKMHAELKLHFTITVQALRETRLGFDKIPDFRRKTGKVLF